MTQDTSGSRLEADLRAHFHQLLNAAITQGRSPTSTRLGPATLAAIETIAIEHPEARPIHIAAVRAIAMPFRFRVVLPMDVQVAHCVCTPCHSCR